MRSFHDFLVAISAILAGIAIGLALFVHSNAGAAKVANDSAAFDITDTSAQNTPTPSPTSTTNTQSLLNLSDSPRS